MKRRLLPILFAVSGAIAGCADTAAPGARAQAPAVPAPAPVTPAVATQAPAPAPMAAAKPPAAPLRAPAPAAAPAAPAPGPEAAFVAPAPIKFEDALQRAGSELMRNSQAVVGSEPRTLVIDPLIDANTGAQTASTVAMGNQLEAIAKRTAPAWKVQPLTRQALASQPLLLIGTLTPVTVERSIDKQPDAYRIWLTVIDLRSNKVVAKNLDRATVDSVNPEPLPFYRDSPTWHKDKTVLGYINSCQVNTRIGDPPDPDYIHHLQAAALINEAITAYDSGQLPAAQRLYRESAAIADPGDLRVWNGLYLTSWQLGQRDAAKEAFAKLVDSGLDAKRLPVKILFQPGRTSFNAIGDLPAQYDLWINTLAHEAGDVPSCVRVVGHTSRTGSVGANEVLSRRRAETIADMLKARNRSLGARLSVAGMGSREALVGLGTDDQRDALDRRVEFRVVDCV